MSLDEALATADDWRLKYIGEFNNAAWWKKEAEAIERQRVAVFRALADLTNKHDDLLTSRNGWRLVAIVMAAGYLVILLNTYAFGGAA